MTNEKQPSNRSAVSRKQRLRIAELGILLLLVGLPVLLVGRSIRQEQRDEALVRAIQRNDTQTALKLLDDGADADALDETYRVGTPFQRLVEDLKAKRKDQYVPPDPVLYMMLTAHYSGFHKMWLPVYPENPVVVKALLDHEADSNTRDTLHTTVLMMAAADGYDATVSLLLEHGADVKAQNYGRGTPLMFAASPCMETLIAHGADLHQAILSAAGRGDVRGVKTLLHHGADANEVDSAPDSSNETPLMAAAMSSAEAVRILLAHGAKVDMQDTGGRTALMVAVREDNPDSVQALLAAGANYKVKNRSGETALLIAIKWKKTRNIALLRQAGAQE